MSRRRPIGEPLRLFDAWPGVPARQHLTVSLALNAPSRVGPALRLRVHETIRELGYVPKAEAAIRGPEGPAGHYPGVVGRFSAVASADERLQGSWSLRLQVGYEVVVYDHGSTTFHPHVLDSLSLALKLRWARPDLTFPIAAVWQAVLQHDHFPTVC